MNGNRHLTDNFRHWFDIARVIVEFLLGVALIIYAAVTPGHDIPFLIAGLVLMGLIPIDILLVRQANRLNGRSGGSSSS